METPKLIKIWDLPLRIFHWLLVAGFFVAYLTEGELLTIHVWAGYLVLGLLIFRLFWGFAGNDNARFSSFLCSPAKSVAYIKDVVALKAKRYLGHNPAGAAMIVLLIVSLFMTVISVKIYALPTGSIWMFFVSIWLLLMLVCNCELSPAVKLRQP